MDYNTGRAVPAPQTTRSYNICELIRANMTTLNPTQTNQTYIGSSHLHVVIYALANGTKVAAVMAPASLYPTQPALRASGCRFIMLTSGQPGADAEAALESLLESTTQQMGQLVSLLYSETIPKPEEQQGQDGYFLD